LLEAFPLVPTRWRTFLASNVGHADAIKHRLKAISMADVIAVALLWCIQNVGHADAIKDRHEYKSIYIRWNWHFDYLFTFAWPATIHQIGHPAGVSIQPMLFWTCDQTTAWKCNWNLRVFASSSYFRSVVTKQSSVEMTILIRVSFWWQFF
jgi:hypothetical protein